MKIFPGILRLSFPMSFAVFSAFALAPRAEAQAIEWKSLGGPKNADGSYQAIRKVVPLSQGPIFILGAGLYRSDNRGTSWYKLSNAADFGFDTDSVLYAAGADGVFSSTNLGLSWQSLNDQLPTMTFNNIAVTRKGTLVVCSDYSIYRSADKGVTWDHVGTNIPINTGQMQMAMTPKGALLLNFHYQSYRSFDDGLTWKTAGSAPAEFTTVRPTVLLAGYQDGNVSRSTNDGISWKQIPISTYSTYTFGKPAVDVIGRVFTGSSQYSGDGVLALSRDSGLTWQYAGSCPDVFSLGFGPDNELYAGTYQSGMFRSLKTLSGVATQGASAFSVTSFPNPVSNSATLVFANGAIHTAAVTISDVTGRTVWQRDAVESPATLDLSQLRDGVYLCQVTCGARACVMRLCIER